MTSERKMAYINDNVSRKGPRQQETSSLEVDAAFGRLVGLVDSQKARCTQDSLAALCSYSLGQHTLARRSASRRHR